MNTIDIRIENDDFVLSSMGEPTLTTESNCIAQDLKHMIREKGYAFSMVGERNGVNIATLCTRIEIEIENDARIYPGTAAVSMQGVNLTCTARTLDNDAIEVAL